MTIRATRRSRAHAMALNSAKKYRPWTDSCMAMSGIRSPTTKNASDDTTTAPSGHRRRNAMGAAIAARPRYSCQTGMSVRRPPPLRSISRPMADNANRTRATVASRRWATAAGRRTHSESSAKKSATRIRHVVTTPA